MIDTIVKVKLTETTIEINDDKKKFDIDLPRYLLLEYLEMHQMTLSKLDKKQVDQLIEASKKVLKSEPVDLEALGLKTLRQDAELILEKKLSKELEKYLGQNNTFLLEGRYVQSRLISQVIKRVSQPKTISDNYSNEKVWLLKLDNEQWRWPVTKNKATCYSKKLINKIGKKRLELYLCEGQCSQLVLKDWWEIKKEDPLVIDLMLNVSQSGIAKVRGVSWLGRQILFETGERW